MKPLRSSLLRASLLSLGLLILTASPASAQYGYGGYGGYGGFGYGGYGYGGLGYGGLGYGGYGGLGYGGYGGFGAIAAPNYGLAYGSYPLFGYTGSPGYGPWGPPYAAYANAYGLGGVGYPGISAKNPYFSFGLSPLAVENAVFERTVLGRGLPAPRSTPANNQGVARPRNFAPVGTGTFSPPQ